ncbi:MAG: leucine-rich repeat protein [Lachnospiraceae bacterium]|nr:leucine-rich repeat protein [Lachnospiraceae bacterium]
MRKGTKIGWLLIALSIMLSVWVITSEGTVADFEEQAGIENDGQSEGELDVEVYDGSEGETADEEVWDGNEDLHEADGESESDAEGMVVENPSGIGFGASNGTAKDDEAYSMREMSEEGDEEIESASVQEDDGDAAEADVVEEDDSDEAAALEEASASAGDSVSKATQNSGTADQADTREAAVDKTETTQAAQTAADDAAKKSSAESSEAKTSEEKATEEVETATAAPKKLSSDSGFVTSNSGRTLEKYTGSSSNVIVPNGITTIASNAFSEASAVNSVTLPATLSSLRQDAFRGNPSIASFSSNSGSFPAYNGCIYMNSGKTLYIVPEGKSGTVNVLDGATAIQNGSLTNCYAVSRIVIPPSVTKIDGIQQAHTVSEIVGASGTAAETYAMNNGIEFVSGSSLRTAKKNAGSGLSVVQAAVEPIITSEDMVQAPTNNSSGGDDTMYYIDGSEENIEYYDGNTGTSSTGSSTAQRNREDDEDEEWYYDEEYDVPDDAVAQQPVPQPVAPVNGSGAVPYGAVASHTLDATPKTADGDIDPRFVFCAALFLGGLTVLFFSHRKTYAYVVRKNPIRDEDELD